MLAIMLLCADVCAVAEQAVLRLPAKLNTIEERAFFGAESLERVIVAEGVTEIASLAFANSSLKEISLPASLVSIEDDVFSGCSGLKVRAPKGSFAYNWAVERGYITELPEIIGTPVVTPESGTEGDTYSVSLRTPANVKYVAISYMQDGAFANAKVFTDGYSDASGAAARVCDYQAGESGDCWDWELTYKFQPSGRKENDYARTTFLAASYDGDEWGPRAESTAFKVKPYVPEITFTKLTAGAGPTRAYAYVYASAAESGNFSESGLRIWDASGNLVVDKKKVSEKTAKTSHIWFDVLSDANTRLQPGSDYTCQMYVVYNGYTVWTDKKSFSTPVNRPGTASITVSQVLKNLENCTDTSILPSGKKDAMLMIAESLLKSGYSNAFVAGVIANVRYEGSFGKFESSAYSSGKPQYLEYMDTLYDYRTKYSGKLVYNGVSLSELSELFDKLAADSFKKGKFGMGSVQWTGGRGHNLMKLYLAEAGESDTITKEQTIAAEMKMIKNELSGSYKNIYPNWKTSNSLNYDSSDAAFDAGYRVCVYYEVPSYTRQKAIDRGATAMKLYEAMMGY